MCSVAGIWRLNGAPVSVPEITEFNDATAYRGPDGDGHFIDANGSLALGHRRLSILDLSDAGRQPMASADGNLVITYNGEVYNYLELRAELAQKGFVFRTGTDTEVILAAYQAWGEDCQFRFNGMWAFAIWNIREQTLFISRDRFGIKPLYYVYRPGKLFAFSSESIAFRKLKGFACSFNDDNVDLAIRNSFYLETAGATVYNEVLKLYPGHSLTLRPRQRLQMRKWWRIEEQLPAEIPASHGEQVERFKEIFLDACRLRLRSDVPVGVALSGGLDSSTVYCTIQQLYNEKVAANEADGLSWRNAFIACFPDTKSDEREYADEVIRFTNGQPNYIFPSEADLADAIYEGTRAEDYIYLSPPVVHRIYREMRARNVKVSLDGHGADEILFGYPHMVEELVEKRNTNGREMLLDVWANMSNVSYAEAEAVFQARDEEEVASATQGRSLTRLIPERYKKLYRTVTGRRSSNWLLHNPPRKKATTTYPYSDDRGLNICYKELHYVLPTLLRNWDRASMRHGVEIRMPFLDWRLVTYLVSLPVSARVGEGYSKKIVRDAMAGWMPDTVRLRKNKLGINAPMEEWFNGPLSPFLLDAVNSRSFLQSRIWNGPVIRDYVETKTRQKSWTQREAMNAWPYLNAWILMR